jgi:hypothetical protein
MKLRLRLLSESGSRFGSGLFLAVAVLPWVAFLGATLPPRYEAGHWNLVWVGFDVGLICVLGYVAWAVWFHRQILPSTTLITGTLLRCDGSDGSNRQMCRSAQGRDIGLESERHQVGVLS